MKTPIAFLLCACLILIPFRSSAPESPPPNGKPPLVLACVVLVVGAVVVWGLWKICQNIPPPNPPPPPPPPPPIRPGTNTNHVAHSSIQLPRLIMPETQLYKMADWQMLVVSFQTSEDNIHWSARLFVTNWFSPTNIVCVAADASGPVATNWLDGPWPTGEAICDFGNLEALLPQGDRKFYRMVQRE